MTFNDIIVATLRSGMRFNKIRETGVPVVGFYVVVTEGNATTVTPGSDICQTQMETCYWKPIKGQKIKSF